MLTSLLIVKMSDTKTTAVLLAAILKSATRHWFIVKPLTIDDWIEDMKNVMDKTSQSLKIEKEKLHRIYMD